MSEHQEKWRDIGAVIPVTIALARAMICVDCDRIFELTHDGRCPLCGSRAVVPVGRWVNSMPETRPRIAG